MCTKPGKDASHNEGPGSDLPRSVHRQGVSPPEAEHAEAESPKSERFLNVETRPISRKKPSSNLYSEPADFLGPALRTPIKPQALFESATNLKPSQREPELLNLSEQNETEHLWLEHATTDTDLVSALDLHAPAHPPSFPADRGDDASAEPIMTEARVEVKTIIDLDPDDSSQVSHDSSGVRPLTAEQLRADDTLMPNSCTSVGLTTSETSSPPKFPIADSPKPSHEVVRPQTEIADNISDEGDFGVDTAQEKTRYHSPDTFEEAQACLTLHKRRFLGSFEDSAENEPPTTPLPTRCWDFASSSLVS